MHKHTIGPWEVSGCTDVQGNILVIAPESFAAHEIVAIIPPLGEEIDLVGDAKDNAILVAEAPDLYLMVWALTNGWDAKKASLYDEEGVDGWRWTDPRGKEYDLIADWSFPEIDEVVREAIRTQKGGA